MKIRPAEQRDGRKPRAHPALPSTPTPSRQGHRLQEQPHRDPRREQRQPAELTMHLPERREKIPVPPRAALTPGLPGRFAGLALGLPGSPGGRTLPNPQSGATPERCRAIPNGLGMEHLRRSSLPSSPGAGRGKPPPKHGCPRWQRRPHPGREARRELTCQDGLAGVGELGFAGGGGGGQAAGRGGGGHGRAAPRLPALPGGGGGDDRLRISGPRPRRGGPGGVTSSRRGAGIPGLGLRREGEGGNKKKKIK